MVQRRDSERRSGVNKRRDYEWSHNRSHADAHCFWSNMPFSKSIAIVVLARMLGVTHLVESGRMGGMQLLNYHRLLCDLSAHQHRALPHRAGP